MIIATRTVEHAIKVNLINVYLVTRKWSYKMALATINVLMASLQNQRNVSHATKTVQHV